MYRHTDGSRLIGEGTRDRLTDPPGRIGGKLEATLRLELLDTTHETHVALLDEIQEAHATSGEALRDGNNQTEVALDEALTRIQVAVLAAIREVELLLRCQQRVASDFLQIDTNRIISGYILEVCECFHIEGSCFAILIGKLLFLEVLIAHIFVLVDSHLRQLIGKLQLVLHVCFVFELVAVCILQQLFRLLLNHRTGAIASIDFDDEILVTFCVLCINFSH